MGAGRPTQWQIADTTIRELYGLEVAASVPRGAPLVRAGKITPQVAAPCEVLLSHASFRALFAAVPPAAYVSGVVVACYLGVSRHAVHRKLFDAYTQVLRSWRSVLSGHMHGGVGEEEGPAFVDERYRWSFVRDELEPMLEANVVRANARREDLRLRAPVLARARRVPLLRIGAKVEATQFVVDHQGIVAGALGQGHIDALTFIDILNAEGRLVALDPVQALSMTWSDIPARSAWESVVLESLLIQADAIRTALATGRAHTEAQVSSAGLPRAAGRG